MSDKDQVLLLDRESIIARVDDLLSKHEANISELLDSVRPDDDDDEPEEMPVRIIIKLKWDEGRVKHKVEITYSLGKVKETVSFYHSPGQGNLFKKGDN